MKNLKKIWAHHSVLSVIESYPHLVNEVYFHKDFNESLRLKSIQHLAEENGITTKTVARFPAEIQEKRHQGTWAVIKKFPTIIFKDFIKNKSNWENENYLMLSGIEDPRNFGAILRSAAAFNINGVIIPNKFQAPLNGVVAQSSAGQIFKNNIITSDHLKNVLEFTNQKEFISARLEVSGTKLREFLTQNSSYKGPKFWILGSEGRGVDNRIKPFINHKVEIPISSDIDSLNVSVAAGILCYELNS